VQPIIEKYLQEKKENNPSIHFTRMTKRPLQFPLEKEDHASLIKR
jgi:hypothetical protein